MQDNNAFDEFFAGTEYIDQVTLAPGLVIPKQSIGVSSDSNDQMLGLDGALGLGPVGLTADTLDPAIHQLIPTVTDNLFGQGAISANQVSISFEPTTVEYIRNGELTFGGTDSSKFTGSIIYTPITSASSASRYWGISQTIKYGTTSILTSAGIVDTSSTLVLLASDSFATYKLLTGGVADEKTGLLRLTSAQFSKLESLFFIIEGTTFELTPNAQIWPRALNTHIHGTADGIYVIVNDLGSQGLGVDFVNGYTFLERFYTVFDTANRRVGLATTSFTKATSN
jgi:cathepsin E